MKDPATTVRAMQDHLQKVGRLRRFWQLVWLAYLPLTFTPWVARPPGRVELIAALAAAAVFVLLLFDGLRRRPEARLPHTVATAALGLALCKLQAGWSFYTIYAMALAGGLAPRRRAIVTLACIDGVMIAAGVGLHLNWISWVTSALVGLVVGFATMMQADMQRKNSELSLAQEEVRALAVTAERERISRDLHDLLGHTLTLVAVKAELAARLVARDAAGAEREMQAVAAAARAALAEVRTAVIGMRGASLSAEIERAREMLAAANVSAEIALGVPTSDPQREAVLAMALREAVTNVIRHARASRCRIRLEEGRAGELRLCVEDNGTGCAATGLEEGAGLTGMRARLAALGGALEISSGRRGTRLLALAPAPSEVTA